MGQLVHMDNPLLDTASLPRFGDIEASDALPAMQQLIAEHAAMLQSLLGSEYELDFDSLVAPLESMNHELERVWSPVGHLQNVLGGKGWRDAYNAVLPLVTEHVTEISQNVELHRAFQKIAESLSDSTPLPMRRLVEQALRDFRLAGVALGNEQKAAFKKTMRELAATRADFAHNVLDASEQWSWHIDDIELLSGLPRAIVKRAREYAQTKNKSGWLFKLDMPNYQAIMTQADNRELRSVFCEAWSTRGSELGDPKHDNTQNIQRILSLRHDVAQLVDYSNYADYSLATKMAGDAKDVIKFLLQLAEKSRKTAEKELAAIQTLTDTPLAKWDIAYFVEKYKQKKFSISDEELRNYFPAPRVLDGLFALATKLYGVRVVPNTTVEIWHDDVEYFDVFGESDERIGGFYADLYAREGKRGGAWVDECIIRRSLGGQTVLPEGFLSCNFTPHDGSNASLLTHSEVVTVFHEFGHMLHHLLTRIDYPSIAGINGVPWDAVELPSQFMENFAWQYEVLLSTSGHHESGDPLPRALFDKLERSRHFGEGLAMLRQLEFALFDIRLHYEYDPENPRDPLAVLRDVRREVNIVHHPEYDRLPHAFVHIFADGYAAGYYSYKWAEVLAADAFAAFEESGLYDRATAQSFRTEILEVGGGRDIMDAFVAFRGRKPTLDALLRHCGFDKAA